MRVFGGCCAREHYASGRSLLGAAPPVPALSLETQRAHLERVLGAAAAVVFLASVSYVTLAVIFGFLCAEGGSRRRPDGGTLAPEPAAAEETKRALEEIPVVLVAVAVAVPDPADRGADGEECAVCLAEYACGEEVRVLPACRHGFHRECLDRWLLTRAPTCPVCRAPVAACPEGHGGKACPTGDAALPAVAVGP